MGTNFASVMQLADMPDLNLGFYRFEACRSHQFNCAEVGDETHLLTVGGSQQKVPLAR